MDVCFMKSCTRNNRSLILRSQDCGCVSCGSVFPACEVVDFADIGQTGVCPECAELAVLPDAAGCDITMESLLGMVESTEGLQYTLVAA